MSYNDLARGVGLQFLISFCFCFFFSFLPFRCLFSLSFYLCTHCLPRSAAASRYSPLSHSSRSLVFVCLFICGHGSLPLTRVHFNCEDLLQGHERRRGEDLSLYCVNTICNDQRHQFFFVR